MPTPIDSAPFDDEARAAMDARLLASANAKPKKSGLSGCTIVAIILCGLWLVGYLGTSKPAPSPGAAPGAPLVVSNIAFADIYTHRKNDTDLQWKSYEPTVVGKRVLWSGTVSDVTEDGEVIIAVPPDPLMWSIYLEGLPNNTVIAMNKGSALQVEATIKRIYGGLGFTYVRLSDVVIR